MTESLSYDAVGSTQIAEAVWGARPSQYRTYERTFRVGSGADLWSRASAEVLRWGVKTRSGFAVADCADVDLQVLPGQDRTLIAALGPFGLREPVRVIAVVVEPNRAGFAYGTRAGHPVAGEEAFIVHRTPDGDIWLTLRSVTGPATGWWRLGFPAALLAQRWYRFRYSRSLRQLG